MYNLINNNLPISVNIIIIYKHIMIVKETFKNIFYFQTLFIIKCLITLRGITEL